MNVATFRRKIKLAWFEGTTAPGWEWSKDNPASGQCVPTALVFEHYFGGDIYRGKIGRGWHYWNVLDGILFDFTYGQFQGPVDVKDVKKCDSKTLMQTQHVRDRYLLLLDRFKQFGE